MKRYWLFIFLASSLVIHLLVLFVVQFDIGAKAAPLIYGWPNIVNSRDLFFADAEVNLSERFVFSMDQVRRDYFSRFSDVFATASDILPEVSLPLPRFAQEASSHDATLTSSDLYYLYLWEQPALSTGQDSERASYRIFVSKQGKILFIYPDKLTTNSSDGLRVQQYIRSASFFLNKNFFWTNIEGVVK